MKKRALVGIGCIVLFLSLGFVTGFFSLTQLSYADTSSATDLQQQISSSTSQIQQLQAEIAQYQQKLDQAKVQATSLQSAVNTLTTNGKKITTQIQLTQTQIQQANEAIAQLSSQISDKQQKITDANKALAQSIKTLNEADAESDLEVFLEYPSISTLEEQLETNKEFQTGLNAYLAQLQGLKQSLVESQDQTKTQESSLVAMKSDQETQEEAIEANKKAQATLLASTKNQESNYQKLIAQKQANEQSFENELNQYEAQLHLTLNPGSVPAANSSLLAWPLTKHTITQYFGNTSFAQQNAAVYNGHGHDGIDIAASIGTPIHAAADGVIQGTGNTDLTCPNASYGKWVMIKHNNGLTTLYGHLSVIDVSIGQTVKQGDVIGLTGETGYATGPHLHLTVIVSSAAEVATLPSKGCQGKIYTMPVADLAAYLNPMQYLPAP